MPEVKFSTLPQTNTLSSTDRVVVLVNPASNATSYTISLANFANSMPARLISSAAPSNNSSNGVAGQIAFTNTHMYLCVSNNSWGRVALTFGW